ncbi:MAG: DUF983 domain-containing protein [Acidobacteria bacterium]|nr:DUF983 domain-containing protein [Acidobacteriota bacterium]
MSFCEFSFESRREVKSTDADVTTMRLPGRFRSFLFLRCPNCRWGRLFNSCIRWIEMNDHCPCCGLGFYPESGYFVGSIYINCGATVTIVIMSLFFSYTVPVSFQLVFFSCLAALTSLAFFRHSRSLWMTIDYWINPWKPPEAAGSVCAADRDPHED